MDPAAHPKKRRNGLLSKGTKRLMWRKPYCVRSTSFTRNQKTIGLLSISHP